MPHEVVVYGAGRAGCYLHGWQTGHKPFRLAWGYDANLGHG